MQVREFPGPGVARFPPGAWIKGVRPPRGATDLAPPALPPPALTLQAPHAAPILRSSELSPMARTATAASAPRAPGLLQAALLLLLLVAACRQAAAAPVDPATAPVVSAAEPVGARELRCLCLEYLDRIHPKYIQDVKVTSPGAYCDKTEVIATLKNGQKVCLNPATPLVKMILKKLLNKASTN